MQLAIAVLSCRRKGTTYWLIAGHTDYNMLNVNHIVLKANIKILGLLLSAEIVTVAVFKVDW